jgi:hypothetical protein
MGRRYAERLRACDASKNQILLIIADGENMTLGARTMLILDCRPQVRPAGDGYTLCRGSNLNANAAEVRL